MREPNNTAKYSAAVIGTGQNWYDARGRLKSDLNRPHILECGARTLNSSLKLFATMILRNLIFAKSHDPSIACYTRPDELLSKHSPDVISISTWRDSHYAIMKLALRHDVSAIVCEKPIAEREEHAREIVAEANRKGIHLLINHRRRFDPLCTL